MADETTPIEAVEDTDGGGTAEEPRVLPDDPILAKLAEAFPEVAFTSFQPLVGPRQDTAHVSRDELLAFVEAVKAAGFETFIDLSATDHLVSDPRYDVNINLLSMQHAQRLLIKVVVPGGEPMVPSISEIYAGANFYEREAWDLFGIEFAGHTDLTRLLLPDDWEGHPLRKDYSVGSVPVQFKGSHKSS